MYRTIMESEQNNMSHADSGGEANVISRVSNLPIVHSAVDQVQNVYNKAKESHPYMKSTLEAAEKTVTVAAETAKPYVNKLEGPLTTANTYANKGLDKLEEKVPVITKPTDEVFEAVKPGVDYVKNVAGYGKDTVSAGVQKIVDTKDLGVQKVVDTASYSKSKVADAKDYTLQHVNAALQTSYGQALIKGVDTVLAKTEEYVDYYLPPEDVDNQKNDSVVCDSPEMIDNGGSEQECGGGEKPETGVQFDQVKRVGELSSKVRKRMYVHALKQMHYLQLRSTQTLQNLHFTVDLIEYAKTNIDNANQKVKDSFQVAQQKVLDTWTELNTDKNTESGSAEASNGSGDQPEKLSEHQTLVLARNLTNMLSVAYHSAYTATYSLLPLTLQKSLEHGKLQVDDLYKAFNQATHFEDISVSWLHQSRERINSVQSELTRVAEAVISSKALSWLVPEFDVNDINLDGEVFGDADGHDLNFSVDDELRAVENIEINAARANANNNARELNNRFELDNPGAEGEVSPVDQELPPQSDHQQEKMTT